MSITPQLKDKFMILGTLLRCSMGCEEKKNLKIKSNIWFKKLNLWDFPGSPGVKTSPFNAGGAGSVPDFEVGPHMPTAKKTKYKTETIL